MVTVLYCLPCETRQLLEINEASNQHAANVLKASSFVLARERTVLVRLPYSLTSRGGSHIIKGIIQINV